MRHQPKPRAPGQALNELEEGEIQKKRKTEENEFN